MLKASSLAAVAILIALVLILQIHSGAYRVDFDGTLDEAGHVVSTLLVRDYLTSGDLFHPWEFAKSYYIHYPRVAILHWPPLFYGSEALWTLGAGRSRIGLFSFQALLCSALATALFLLLRAQFGLWMALLSAILFLTTPLIRLSVAMISPDLLLAGLVFAAAAWYASKWETRSGKWVVALLGAAALATHGRGAAFLMVPSLAPVFLKGRTMARLLAITVVLVVFVTVPHLLRQAGPTTPQAILQHAIAYLITLGSALRWPVLAMVGVGVWVTVKSPQDNRLLKLMLATLLACWIFQSLVNVPLTDYYVITAIPSALVLATAGVNQVFQYLAHPLWRRGAATIALGIALFNIVTMPLKEDVGALRFTQKNYVYEDGRKIWLVAADTLFEGALIADVALRDTARQHIVLRASKMLAASSWNGAGYRLRLPQEEISPLLKNAHVGWVISRSYDAFPHLGQLRAALAADSQTWQPVASSDSINGVVLFKNIAPFPPGPIKLEIDMNDKLGMTLRFSE